MAKKPRTTPLTAQHPDSVAWLHQCDDWLALYGTYRQASCGLESALELLEDAAPLLERTELPLDDLLQIYEKSVALARHLQGILESARQRVETLASVASENDDHVDD